MSSVYLIVLGYVFVLLSLYYFYFKNTKVAIWLLLLSALVIFISATMWFPFLNIWDERFHALVAKNLMKHPLKPTLYDEMVIDADHSYWVSYHIWLHKQPGFLWQIMVSYFVFGVNEFALRLPSALAFTALTFAIYKSGLILVNQRVGYYAAFLFVSALFFVEMVAGFSQLDHHDVMSITYASLSIWAFLEYNQKASFKWLLLIGIFCGLAVLNKWLVGLIVFLIWGVFNLLKYQFTLKKYLPMVSALAIALLISVPWQVYIYTTYPQEAQAASGFFIEHFFEVLENHSGSFWYHVKLLPKQFGPGAMVLFIPALLLLGKHMKFSKLFAAFVFAIVFVFTFFGLAATKMPSFTLIVALPIFVAFGVLLFEIDALGRRFFNKRTWGLVFTGALFVSFILRINVVHIYEKHPLNKIDNACYERLYENKEYYTSLQLPDNAVMFNVKGLHFVEAMFYTPAIVYNFVPSERQVNQALGKEKSIYVLKGGDELPSYLTNNSRIKILNYTSQVCE